MYIRSPGLLNSMTVLIQEESVTLSQPDYDTADKIDIKTKGMFPRDWHEFESLHQQHTAVQMNGENNTFFMLFRLDMVCFTKTIVLLYGISIITWKTVFMLASPKKDA